MISKESLFEQVKKIHDQIPTDVLGGSPLNKCFLMAYLAKRLQLKNFVEIGVYRGKSLFSVGVAFQNNNGKAYGIDPWRPENLRENDLDAEIKAVIDGKSNTCDFDELYSSVVDNMSLFKLNDTITLLRKTSEDAFDYFYNHFNFENSKIRTFREGEESKVVRPQAFIDMLHIDGNHDYKNVKRDAELYLPLVRKGGIIVFDDINWTGPGRVYKAVKDNYIVLYENSNFAVLLQDMEMRESLRNEQFPPLRFSEYKQIQSMLPPLVENVDWAEKIKNVNQPYRIFVGVMTYNSSAYIEECVQSIISQKGPIEIELGVFDDCSTDNTIEVIKSIALIPENVHLSIYTKNHNEGYEKNYIRVFRAFEKSDCDFFACIDGDDYLISPYRFLRHIEEMARHPDCAVTFNRLILYIQEQNKYEVWDYQDKLTEENYTAFDIANQYFIGNGSCSMIRRNAVLGISEDLYIKSKIGDWLTHCIYAMKGDICYINEIMNVYRKHKDGVWSGTQQKKKNVLLRKMIVEFNKITQYLFYSQLYVYLDDLFREGTPEKQDLTVIDDVFPHPVSGFRMEEYCVYLKRFEKLQILCNGGSTIALGNISHQQILSAFKQAHPEIADKLIEAIHSYIKPYSETTKILSKLAYFCFLGNIYTSINLIERSKVPFVFELYPGGSFALGQSQSDRMLRRVLNSPCFTKVIVTQDITREYLIKNKLCRPDQIVSIFGVVTPWDLLKTIPQINESSNGSTLKVCFAAMRYTLDGRDKGYDVFVDVIKILAQKHNIEFHVAGKFDKYTIPLNELSERVTFHGILSNDNLHKMMKEMDIIVSPNINNIIQPGAFDGFPTATCTEAGLNGVLIMCTDPLELNNGRFKNRQEIEIVPHDAKIIAKRIEFYDRNREALRNVIRNQYERIQQLYSIENQLGKRIEVLEREIERYPENMRRIRESNFSKIYRMGRLFYSDVIDQFDINDVIDFDYEIDSSGSLNAAIPLGNLKKNGAFIWIYFCNNESSIIRFNRLIFCEKDLQIQECSNQRLHGQYFFEDKTPFIYLGYVKFDNVENSWLNIEASIRFLSAEKVREEVEIEKQLELSGAILHAECIEDVGKCAPIPFEYTIQRDGSFMFEVNIDNIPATHKHIWVYFVANNRCKCKFESIQINNCPIKIDNTNGLPDVNGVFHYDTIEPFIYFENSPLRNGSNLLTVRGKIALIAEK